MKPSEFKSSWEYTKQKSSYHFEKNRKDRPGEWFWVIGNFENTWSEYLPHIQNHTRPMTWESRKFTIGRNGPVSPMLAQEEYDIQQGGGNPKMTLLDIIDDFSAYPKLKPIIDFFALEQCMPRLHVQRTGQVFNRHIDKIGNIWPDEPASRVVRIVVMLQDWEPGQFYQYGNLMYEDWKAGDVHWFDWQNVPHCTANASNQARVNLQLTGLRTPTTDAILADKTIRQFQI